MTRFFDWHFGLGVVSPFAVLRALLVVVALSFGISACTQAPQKPPESALKQAIKDDRVIDEDRRDFRRRHVAPPPAYGNKIVLADQGLGPKGSL